MTQSGKNETGAGYPLIQLKAVGTVRNQSRDPGRGGTLGGPGWRDRAARMREQREAVSEIVIDASLDGIIDGIDDFSHITVLYWAHLVPPERRTTTRVHPMGNKDFPLVGVFATQSPVRPNSILVTTVRLLERKGNVLKVTELDALDGSLVLDIKPYVPERREFKDARIPDWMKKIHQEFSDG